MGESHGQSDSGTAQSYPDKPVKLIVPFSPGGGSDTFARIIDKAIKDHDLLPQPLVIINVPGAGSTIGSRRVKNAPPDGYTLLMLHEAILTAKHSGTAEYGPEAFEAIAATGEGNLVIAVAEDSQYKDLDDLMDAAQAHPNRLIFSANIGTPSHFGGLLLERERPGSAFRYTQHGDGAKRYGALVGGHCDATLFAVAEYVQFREGGIRALCVARPNRHPDLPDVPTAVEQGYDLVNSNMHFWWAPKGTSQEKLDVIAEALRKAMQTEDVQRQLDHLRMNNVYLTGDDLDNKLKEMSKRIESVAERSTITLPDFPMYILAATTLLAVIVLAQSTRDWYRSRAEKHSAPRVDQPMKAPTTELPYLPASWLAAGVLLLTTLYVVILQLDYLDFRSATVTYVLILGLLLAGPSPRRIAVLGSAAIVMGVGLHWLLTSVFVIDLP